MSSLGRMWRSWFWIGGKTNWTLVYRTLLPATPLPVVIYCLVKGLNASKVADEESRLAYEHLLQTDSAFADGVKEHQQRMAERRSRIPDGPPVLRWLQPGVQPLNFVKEDEARLKDQFVKRSTELEKLRSEPAAGLSAERRDALIEAAVSAHKKTTE